MLIFISSNKWLRSEYGGKLRSHLSDKSNVINIIDFGDLPVFESAAAYPMILVAQKTESNNRARLLRVESLCSPYPDIFALLGLYSRLLPVDALNGKDWNLSDSEYAQLSLAKNFQATPLVQYVKGKIFNGVKSGLAPAFIIDEETRRNFLSLGPEYARVIKPTVDGGDLRRYYIQFRKAYMLYIRWNEDISRYPAIYDHLERHRVELEKRNGTRDSGRCPWFALSRPRPESAELYEHPKILYPDISKSVRFSLDTSGYYPGNTAYCIPSDDLYLLGLLNSNVVEEYYAGFSAQVRGGYLRFFRPYVEKIPIPDPPASERAAVVALVQQCLGARGQGPMVEQWEADINERVAWLYGLKASDVGANVDDRAAEIGVASSTSRR
jgi:hypothetical protein